MSSGGNRFASADAKVARAREHTQTLQAEFERFSNEETHTISQQLDPKTGRKSAIYRVARDFPDVWPVIIGEITHNLRSALDHAIEALTVAEQGQPLAGTEFPIFDDESKYFRVDKHGNPTRGSGLYKIRGINDRAREVVKDLQPFEHRKREPADQEPTLAILRQLNTIDKHRTLHLCRRSTTEIGLHVLRDIRLPINWSLASTLEDGTHLADWEPTIPDDEMDVEIKLGYVVAFGDTLPRIQNQPVIRGCETMIQAATSVLELLAAAR